MNKKFKFESPQRNETITPWISCGIPHFTNSFLSKGKV